MLIGTSWWSNGKDFALFQFKECSLTPGQETKTPTQARGQKHRNSNAANSIKTSKNVFKKTVLVVIIGCYTLRLIAQLTHNRLNLNQGVPDQSLYATPLLPHPSGMPGNSRTAAKVGRGQSRVNASTTEPVRSNPYREGGSYLVPDAIVTDALGAGLSGTQLPSSITWCGGQKQPKGWYPRRSS